MYLLTILLYIGLLYSTQLTQLIIRCILSLSLSIDKHSYGNPPAFYFSLFYIFLQWYQSKVLNTISLIRIVLAMEEYYYCYFVNIDPVWSNITVLGQEENKRNGWLV